MEVLDGGGRNAWNCCTLYLKVQFVPHVIDTLKTSAVNVVWADNLFIVRTIWIV
jgi:hypothetical protein